MCGGRAADGRLGPETLAAVSRMNPADLTSRLADERLDFYRGLSTFSTFGAGWTRRVDEVKADALKMLALFDAAARGLGAAATGRGIGPQPPLRAIRLAARLGASRSHVGNFFLDSAGHSVS